LKDHLLNEQTYRILSPADADAEFDSFDEDMLDFFKYRSRYLTKKENQYLNTSLIVKDRYAYFYGTMKIHKSPATTRPIVAVTGSLLDGLGQWLDVQLQPLARHFKSYIRDSADLVTRWSLLRDLPPSVRIFTMDAVAMYSNIDPIHCLSSLRAYLTNNPVSRELDLYSR
jgi:hypothetical protein